MRFRLSLRAKLYALAALALTVIAILAAMMFYGNATSIEALRQVYEENVIPLQHIQDIDDRIGEVRFRVAGVITDQMPAPGSRRHLAEVRERLPALWADYRRLTVIRPNETAERTLTEELEAGLERLPALFDKLDRSYAASNDKELLTAILEDDWPHVIVGVSKPLEALIAMRTEEVATVYRDAELREGQLRRVAVGLIALTVSLLAIFTTLIIRSITVPVADVQRALRMVAQGDLTAKATRHGDDELGDMAQAINGSLATLCQTLSDVSRGADRVAGASDNVSARAADIRGRAEAQTGEVMKLTSAMQQLTVSVGEISSGSAQVSEAAARARDAAERGERLMGVSRVATERAQSATNRASEAVGALSTSIKQINAISSAIRDIADQTNLLALNAAIEAARAGSAGRGFAVVADEVRKLAERTGHSTAEIATIVSTVEQQAANAVTAMREVDTDVAEDASTIGRLESAFAMILEAAKQVSALADDIAHSTREQELVAEQTAAGMETISQAVEHTCSTIGVMASAAGESAQTAAALRQLVTRFRTA